MFSLFFINAYAFYNWMYMFLQHRVETLYGKTPSILKRSISCPCILGNHSRVLRSKICGQFVSVDFQVFIIETSAEFCVENSYAAAACSSFQFSLRNYGDSKALILQVFTITSLRGKQKMNYVMLETYFYIFIAMKLLE